MANWFKQHGVNLLLIAMVLTGIYFVQFKGLGWEESLQTALNDVLVIGGIGFLIFIHELGHFLAAKACNVRVETFSVGFGPPIPGCHFQYGETFYKLALIPIGGYVKMPGEYPSETMDEQIANDPRSFMNKSVGQRMIIISAGVIMNVLLALVIFVYVYLTGKTELVPRLGAIESGSPAANAGMVAGSELTQVGSDDRPTFEDLFYSAALSRPGVTQIDFKWKTPWGEDRANQIIPNKRDTDVKPYIGVGHPQGLTVVRGDKEGLAVAQEGTPAAAASFKGGDRLTAVKGADETEFKPLKNGWDYAKAEYDYRGQPMDVQVSRDGTQTTVRVEPHYFQSYGFILEMGPIVAVRDRRYTPPSAQPFAIGDVIVALDGDRNFDPIKLPDLVMDKAATSPKVVFTVRRGEEELDIPVESSEIRGRGTWNEEHPVGLNSPISIPALGIAYDVRPTIRGIVPDSPAAKAKLNVGDVIEEVQFPTPPVGKAPTYSLQKYQWPALFLRLQNYKNKEITLTVRETSGETRILKLSPETDKSWPLPKRGLWLELDRTTFKAQSVGEAMELGLRYTYRFIGRIYLNLRGLLTRNLDPTLLSGPFEMVKTTFAMAEQGFNDYLLFLGVISVNLAVVNFLPIPILDGGHMIFLLVEKLRGKPATERALIIANSIGLIFILSLMAFVVILDFTKMQFIRNLFQL